LGQALFLFQIFNALGPDNFHYSIPLFAATTVCGVLCFVFTKANHSWVHHFLGGLGFAAASLGSIFYGFEVYRLDQTLGVINLVLALWVSLSLVNGFIKTETKPKTIAIRYEYVFFGGVLLWDLINTSLLF